MSSEKALAQATGSLGLSSHSFHLSAPHWVRSVRWRWATSSTGFTLPLPPPSSLCVFEWAALGSPCPSTVMVCLQNKVYFDYCFKLVKDWGLYVQSKPQAISSSERLKQLSWFLDLPTFKLAGETQTNPSDLVFSSFQQAVHWDSGARRGIPCL